MRLCWEWLRNVAAVPFVPTLGPVHPDDFSPRQFVDVASIAGTGRFVPYDKDRRWADIKTETVLVPDIVHEPRLTLIPTLSRQGDGRVTTYLYGSAPSSREVATELTAKLRARFRVIDQRVVSFLGPEGQPPPDADVTRVQLRELSPDQSLSSPTGSSMMVSSLCDCAPAVQATFPRFARVLAREGFEFLHSRMRTGDVGPVMVAIDAEGIAGAIGPMEIIRDSRGVARLLPQYFGVLPEHRGRGYGRALWRAAMQWGLANAATYQVLQTEFGSPSDHLCRAEGLRSLGFVCTSNLA